MVGLVDGDKTLRMCYRLDRIPACVRQTDGRTSCHGIVRTVHTRRAVKRGHVIQTTPVSGEFLSPGVELAIVDAFCQI